MVGGALVNAVMEACIRQTEPVWSRTNKVLTPSGVKKGENVQVRSLPYHLF